MAESKISVEQLRILEESHTRYQLLTEAIPQVVWSTDPDGFCDYMGPKWKELTGGEPEDALKTGWMQKMHPDDRDDVWNTWQNCVEKLSVFEDEYRLLNTAGEYRWFLALGLPRLNEKGVLVSWFGTLTDIHERKERADELEKAVALRTHELNVALSAKTQFLAILSHEMRTPMAGIMGLIELLALEDLGAENNELTSTILNSAKRILNLLNNTLDGAKLEFNKLKLEKKSFSMRNLFDDVHKLFYAEASKKKLTINKVCSPELPEHLSGDVSRLQQILSNLVHNAVKFTDSGAITLSGEKLSENENEVVVQFAVEDTGIGLNPEQLKRLFVPFEQATPATSRVKGGTGLGLSIVRELVELMGGEIRAESEYAKGSRFSFVLTFSRE